MSEVGFRLEEQLEANTADETAVVRARVLWYCERKGLCSTTQAEILSMLEIA